MANEDDLPEGTLDLANGSISITATGYTQGDAEAETAYTGSYIITQSTKVTSNYIVLQGVAEDQTVTLNGVNIENPSSGTSAITVRGYDANGKEASTSVTLLLQGENIVKGINNWPGILVWKSATLTIDDCEDGTGKLTAVGHNNSAGIGAPNGQINQAYGSIVINGGEITATGGNNSAAAGIGSGYGRAATKVTVNGGIIHASGGCALRAREVVVNGGWLDYTGTGEVLSRYDASANSKDPVVTGGSLTKGKDAYGTYRRVLILFGDGTDTPKILANTEVTVTVDADTSWSASTDNNGFLYAYLPEDMDTVSVRIPGEKEDRIISLKDASGEKGVLSGISCICDEKQGKLTMRTTSQSLTAINGEASLSLAASYTSLDECQVPEGYHFHGNYEDISYEIVSVTRNGQSVTPDRYAAIKGSTLTVYDDADGDTYAVKVRAVCGPEKNLVYSEPITVTVGTYIPVAADGTLDIGLGSILITETGYSQGVLRFTSGKGLSVVNAEGSPVPETKWIDDEHALTVVGSSVSVNSAVATNHIVITGGDPTITLKNVTITKGSNGNTSDAGYPAIALISGTSDAAKTTATLVLEGKNTLTGSDMVPAVQINKYAELTIQGEGSLNATGGRNCPGIGSTRRSAPPYAINPTTNKVDNNYRSGGNLVIKSGTITSQSGGSTSAALGTSNETTKFGSITINGGTVNAITAGNGAPGMLAQNITISDGLIYMEAVNSSHYTNGIGAYTSFSMAGGTVTMGKNGKAIWANSSTSITGGNVNTYYTGTEKDGRVLTKLYFVNEDGSPVVNTEVSVTESGNTWKALTNDKGIITTYFAQDTDSISASYGDKTYNSVEIRNQQALIGGECTCKDFTGITWESGLPDSVTLYGESDSTYSVAEADLVVEDACLMPIHPNLTNINYGLSVMKDGAEVEDASSYAVLENSTLTLKSADAPYTVTLTATAGDKCVDQTVAVNKGAAEENMTTIDLTSGDVEISYDSETNTYSYKQGSGTDSINAASNILLTGNAANAAVTVNGGSPSLTVNQDSADNIWVIYTAKDADALTLNAQTVNGKVRFGELGDVQAALSYISADKIKLNPDSGDITFNADGSITQGKVTITDLDAQEISVMGADIEAARNITNNRSEALTLTVNNEEVTLKSGGIYPVEKALGSEQNTAGTTKTYLLPGGADIYEHYTVADGNRSYEVCTYGESSTSENNLVEGYRLLIIAEGDGDLGGYGFANKVVFEKGNDKYTTYYTNSRITDAVIDSDLTGTLYAVRVLYGVNLKELHAESVGNIAVYASTLGDLYLGEHLSGFTWGNYCTTTSIHVPESNPYFAVDDEEHGGVLYTKDFSTLLLIPAQRTADYTVREECTTIKANATMQCNVGTLTIGKNVSYIGGTYIFFNNRIGEFRVIAGNQYFTAKDGILYSTDVTRMVAYPRAKTDTTLVIPSSVTYVESLILAGTPIETLIVEEGANITGDQVGLGRITGLKEVILKGNYAGRYQGSYELAKLTVPDGFNFSRNLNDCSMGWISENISNKWTGKITVSGVSSDETIPYDGEAHGITVATTAGGTTVEYSADGETYSQTALTYTAPGTYTVYWRIIKAADENYQFDRELYSSRTFTISDIEAIEAIEASEDWFTLASSVTVNNNPVTLSQPFGTPSLKDGYIVKYSKDGTGEPSENIPEEAGNYLVTVEITADGYVKEILTLGYCTFLQSGQEPVSISFVTYGGTAIAPLTWNSDDVDSKTKPYDPTRNGYRFAGWYSDASLRTKADLSDPISRPAENTTYYAKWIRETYHITYLDLNDAMNNNPTTYTVESPAFTLNPPTRAGYTFTGWTIDGEMEQTVTIPHGSWGDKSYTANWEMTEYTITYTNVEGMESNPNSYKIEDTSEESISLNIPTEREGYTFFGWQMTVNGVNYIIPASDAKIPQGTIGNIELSGIWLADGQTLTLDANGGTFADGNETMAITADYASSITLTQPTRNGYRFAGWYADETLETPFEAAAMPLSTTIYAKWESGLDITPSTNRMNGGGTITLTVANAIGTASVTCDNGIIVNRSGNSWTASLPNSDATYTFTVTAENGTKNCTVSVTQLMDGGTADTTTTGNGTLIDGNENATPDKITVNYTTTITAEEENVLVSRTTIPSGYRAARDFFGLSLKVNGVPAAANTTLNREISVTIPYNVARRTYYKVACLNDNGTIVIKDAIVDYTGQTLTVSLDNFGQRLMVLSKTYSSSGSGSSSKTYYTIQAEASAGGKISSSGSYSVVKNGSKTYRMTPHEGYAIQDVIVDGKSVGAVSSYTFSNVTKTHTIKAIFMKETELPTETAYAEEAVIILTINEKEASVFGEKVMNDVPPIIRNDRTMLPIRFVAEALGASVGWNDALKKVTITKDDLLIEITIGSPIAYVNNTAVVLDSPAFIENDRTYLPIRFVAENLGATVLWDSKTQKVIIIPGMETK